MRRSTNSADFERTPLQYPGGKGVFLPWQCSFPVAWAKLRLPLIGWGPRTHLWVLPPSILGWGGERALISIIREIWHKASSNILITRGMYSKIYLRSRFHARGLLPKGPRQLIYEFWRSVPFWSRKPLVICAYKDFSAVTARSRIVRDYEDAITNTGRGDLTRGESSFTPVAWAEVGFLRFHTSSLRAPPNPNLGRVSWGGRFPNSNSSDLAGLFFGISALLHGFSFPPFFFLFFFKAGQGGFCPTSAFPCDGALRTFCSRHTREWCRAQQLESIILNCKDTQLRIRGVYVNSSI
jgi:hypothetical protein